MNEDKVVVIIERECGRTLFIELHDSVIITCIDESGNGIELTEEEEKYVFIKYKYGECDARYSWGSIESNTE